MKPYLDYNGLAVLAHRGGVEESYENTLESFQYSQSIGCEFIETDVQVSADGVPYIFHDKDLKRILDLDKRFDSLLSTEIDKLNIFENYKIPKLEEALNEFPDIKFQIDFKSDEVVQPALNIIEKLNDLDRVCIASFNSSRLKRVREQYPNLCVSRGPIEVFQTLLSSVHLYKKFIPGECLQIPMKYYGVRVVTKKFVNYLKTNSLKIMVWTINDVKTFKYLMELNVDGIITDRPQLLFDTLKENL